MTVGIDLSPLFTEVLMFSYVNDVISKKMIYFYITSYYENNEQLAMMALNTFLKDCGSPNGIIRGLALRSLCSLKIQSALEYIEKQVMEMLEDKDSYVRKLAVMGLLRLYYINNEFFEENNLLDRLYNFLKDPNKAVVASTINAIEEIMSEEGGMNINSKIVLYLMNRFTEFDCYGKTQVCALLLRYTPRNKEEMFNIMNLLEDTLCKSTTPLKLMIVAIFIAFTKNDIVQFENVMKRVASELVSMSCSCDDEQLFVILENVLSLVRSPAKRHYCEHYRLFYLRGSEKTYNAKLKIQILEELVDHNSVSHIMEEFSEYTSERHISLAHVAINALTKIMLDFPEHANVIMKRLLIFIKIGKIELVKAILDSLKNVIQNVSEASEELMVLFERAALDNSDEQVLIALLRIFTQIPDRIKNTPYIIEVILENMIDREQKYSRDLFLALLTASVYVFMKKPGEMFPVLSKLFQYFFESENPYNSDIDISERVMFYYNALKQDVLAFKETVGKKAVLVNKVFDRDTFLQHFDTFGMTDLRIVYKKQTDKFTKPLSFFNRNCGIKKLEVSIHESEENEEENEQQSDKELSDLGETPTGQSDHILIDIIQPGAIDILDLDFTQPEIDKVLPNTKSHPPVAQHKFSLDSLEEEEFEFDDEEFQSKWAGMKFE